MAKTKGGEVIKKNDQHLENIQLRTGAQKDQGVLTSKTNVLLSRRAEKNTGRWYMSGNLLGGVGLGRKYESQVRRKGKKGTWRHNAAGKW